MLLLGCRRQIGEACGVLALPRPAQSTRRATRAGCDAGASAVTSKGSVTAGWDRLVRVRQPCSLESWLGSWESRNSRCAQEAAPYQGAKKDPVLMD